MLLRMLFISYFSMLDVCSVDHEVLLTLNTTGWLRGKERTEWKRKIGLKEETVLVFLKHDNQVVKREPFRDHNLGIFIFFKFIC